MKLALTGGAGFLVPKECWTRVDGCRWRTGWKPHPSTGGGIRRMQSIFRPMRYTLGLVR
ncbi:MAG: hypothetical protein KAV99_01520 [Candidatus Latescibacteria bacterium]|nr:hypothetical protein [Candidatus Latescibacterota bacterium]